VTFQVARSPAPPAGRELVSVQPDAKNATLRRFTARPGINTLTDEALVRYQSSIGLPAADLVATGPGKPSATRPSRSVTRYQQYAQGYQVVGHGFLVDSENGIFRSANGKVAPNLPAFSPPTVSASAALQTALAFLKITRAPWVANPSQFQAPTGTLFVVPKRPVPAASDFALAWNFPLGGRTGIGSATSIEIDAANGAVIAANPGTEPVSTFDPKASTFVQTVTGSVDTIYSGLQPFTIAQYRRADSSIVETLANRDVNADGVFATVRSSSSGWPPRNGRSSSRARSWRSSG
jgi:hypothetical protein